MLSKSFPSDDWPEFRRRLMRDGWRSEGNDGWRHPVTGAWFYPHRYDWRWGCEWERWARAGLMPPPF